jgi:O-antigen/teichoic acid export membrane protein
VITQSRLSVGATAVFITRTLGLVLAAATTFVLARLLGPTDMGRYYLLALVPPTTLALLSWGLPSALTYFTGRNEGLNEIRTSAIVLAVAIGAAIVALLVALEPVLSTTVLAAVPVALLPIAFAAIPAVFAISFCNAVILGRQRLRAYNALQATQSIALFIGQVLAVGVLHAGLRGAITTYFVAMTGVSLVSFLTMARIAPFRFTARVATFGRLLRYGVLTQPATMAGFFNYRADVYLMGLLLHDATALGVYGLAVNIAELCFFIPDAVSTVLFPRIAAAGADQAASIVPGVTRTVLLLTALVAVAIAVAAVVLLPIFLPAFRGSIAPALVLLPAVVSLAASKVLSAYLTGTGHPGWVSMVSTVALITNLVVNLILIPVLGPTGAAAASLVSYSLHAMLMIRLASRQAAVPVAAMIVPRRADVALVVSTLRAPLTRLRAPQG